MSSLRILFVGLVEPFLTTAARRDAFDELGIPVETVDERGYLKSASGPLRRLAYWTSLSPGCFRFNRDILAAGRSFRPNVVWIEKGIHVFPRTLRALRRQGGMALVHHNTDDWRAPIPLRRLLWRLLLRGLPLYHAHVTSNVHNVREYRDAGLPNVFHMELAANPAIPDPGPLPEEERARLGGPVGFIGHWEPATERLLLHLVRSGLPLKIYGGGWGQARRRRELAGALQHRYVWGEEYARAIRSFDVNLGIVSKNNRNHTASRSFQIPACGGFLLHERNELMSDYFREGVEVAFFDPASPEDLLQKCRHYLAHPEERLRIAAAGQRRCRESGYFESDRVREILPKLEAVVAEVERGAG